MTISQHSLDEARERAALYALGALRGDEAREFEAHLATRCDVCTEEVRTFSAVAANLDQLVQPQAPQPSVRARVLERVANESVLVRQPAYEKDGVNFVRPTHLAWEAGNAPGIEIKTLSVDAQRGYVTQLVRMPAGSSLRPHRHADVEESYLIEGDLLVSGVLMHAGDYCRAEPNSVHSGVTTQGGCVFIAVYSSRDELLA